MNTFHPYRDDENEIIDEENTEDIDAQNYSQNYDQRFHNQHTESGMFPPDESIIQIDQLNNRNIQNFEEKYIAKPKSRSRYEGEMETGNFKERRKQWNQRNSDISQDNSQVNYSNNNLNIKDRQYLERKYENTQYEENLYPDVSQINEDEFLSRDDISVNPSTYRASNVEQRVVGQMKRVDNEAAELIEIHNMMFWKAQEMYSDDQSVEKIRNLERVFKSMLDKCIQNNSDVTTSEAIPDLNQIKSYMQQINLKQEEKFVNKETPMNQSEIFKNSRENQNIHPNIKNKEYYEEDKVDQSMLNESALNNRMKFINQAYINDPVTPESIRKKVTMSREMPELGMRAQRYDSIHDNSPIHPINNLTENEDPNDESNKDESSLTFQERLTSKKWQFRK